MNTETVKPELAGLLADLVQEDGYYPTTVPGLFVNRVTGYEPRHPVNYDPSIIIVAQGRKVGYIGDRRFTYDASQYLVTTMPLPFECEVFAQSGAPYLALAVTVDPLILGEIVGELSPADFLAYRTPGLPACAGSSAMDPGMEDAAVRLLRCLADPAESRILGPQTIREILFRVLKGPQGHQLYELTQQGSHFYQIAQVLKRLHCDYGQALDIGTLAREAGMSVSTFHHSFKAVTATSPLRYLKNVRLHKARLLMTQEGLPASTAANRVGYESPSQFSREFKRFFGLSPSEAKR